MPDYHCRAGFRRESFVPTQRVCSIGCRGVDRAGQRQIGYTSTFGAAKKRPPSNASHPECLGQRRRHMTRTRNQSVRPVSSSKTMYRPHPTLPPGLRSAIVGIAFEYDGVRRCRATSANYQNVVVFVRRSHGVVDDTRRCSCSEYQVTELVKHFTCSLATSSNRFACCPYNRASALNPLT